MKKVDIAILLLITAVVGFLLYFSRQIFTYHYEPEYYENYYYNSQWNVPQSARGISDGELYKFVGYRLVQGENPFNINYEVPPFAKHLYGLAEMYLGNPYWVSLFFFFLTGLAVYLLCFELLKNNTYALLGVLLFVTTPFFATQIKETMLDLPLTALLSLHALFFVRYFKKTDLKDLALAGIFLGLFTGTKIGVYTPLILLLGVVICLISSRKILSPVIYTVSVFGGYVLSFISYFSRHPNPFPWLRLHEKPIGFYLQTASDGVDHWNQWRGIFQNTYQGFWVGASKGGLGDWSLILPIGVILAVILFYQGLKKKDFSWIYLTLLAFSILLVNTFIPFWPRYLMPTVPLFIVFLIFAFRKITPLIFLLAALSFSVLLPTFTINNLSGHAEAVARFTSTRAYRELYRSVDPATWSNYPEKEFQAIFENFYSTLRVKKISVTLNNSDTAGGKATLNTKYFSDYGILENSQEMDFVFINNQWKTAWKWDYLWPGFDPRGRVEIEKTSKLLKKSQKAVYVIPRLMYDWGKYSQALSRLTRLGSSVVDKILREVIPDDYPRFVGYLDPGMDPDTLKNNLLPGIAVREEPAVYSGTIIFVDAQGNQTQLPIKPN
ncbi:MAG: hypothetical protein UW80_C0003G0002 [Microgenomates group bacterium GW2011_GWC1_44_9]|nr:MAG: hypothetical protein UW80_C0003G0002 [Microgenomates group bacterium GW2011_GWC1_44_9]